MIVFDKVEIKDSLSSENIFELLVDFGGDPEYSSFGILCSTICHNPPGEGSRKLYFYDNSHLFRCYTGCDSYFDIFELVIKVAKIQWDKDYDLNDAVRWVAQRFGISGENVEEDECKQLEDWKILATYDKIQELEVKDKKVVLKTYNEDILSRFNYNVKIGPWLNEGISQEALDQAMIGFYPGGDQITIPHFDINGRFIGLRGRTLCKEEGERYGKYRPLKVGKDLYNHPLGMSLYNLNNSKDNIKLIKKAIVFEGEKSTLLYQSYFGLENDISVACCGSSLSTYQVQELIDVGAEEIIIAFDRQFKEIGDEEFQHLKKNLLKLRTKYKNYVNISFIFDKNMITGYKASPIDEGKEKFLQLFLKIALIKDTLNFQHFQAILIAILQTKKFLFAKKCFSKISKTRISL